MRRKYSFASPSTVVAPLTPQSPAEISEQLTAIERRIGEQKLETVRARYARDRTYWETIAAAKDAEIVELRGRLTELSTALDKARAEQEDLQSVQTEHLQAAIGVLEARRSSDKKKLDAIVAELKVMMATAAAARASLAGEREKLHQIRKDYARRQRRFEETMRQKELENGALHESLALAEQVAAKELERMAAEVRSLSEALAVEKAARAEETAGSTAVLSKRSHEVEKLRAGLEDAIVQLTRERRRADDLQRRLFESEQRASQLAGEARRSARETRVPEEASQSPTGS